MRERIEPRIDWPLLIFWSGWLALVLILASLFIGCRTVAMFVEAPEGYWDYTYRIVEALAEDLWSFVRFFIL